MKPITPIELADLVESMLWTIKTFDETCMETDTCTVGYRVS